MSSTQFSEVLPLFNGGCLDRLMRKIGLGDDSRRQKFRQIIFWVAVTWLPPFIFACIGGLVTSKTPRVPFWGDFSFHIRFLVALPSLIAAERYVRVRTGDAIQLLVERDMIGAQSVPALSKTEAWIRTLRDSAFAEVAILALAVCVVATRSMIALPHEVTSWKRLGTMPSVLAHAWYMWVSLVVYFFFSLRWVWRYLLWSFFLVRLAFMKPNLQSNHPDSMGGLSFLVQRHVNFAIMALPVSAVASTNVAERLVYGGQRLESWQYPIVAYFFVALLVFLAPLAVFTPLLIRTKREGLHRYGDFGTRYAELFNTRWLSPRDSSRQNPLGDPDIQSLNDLLGSYAHLKEMKLFLMSRRPLIGLAAFIASPFLPLLLFKVPLVDLLASAARFVL